MKKEQWIASILTMLLFLSGLFGLFFLVDNSKEHNYVSHIEERLDIESGQTLFYYWAKEKQVDDKLFVQSEVDENGGTVIVSYDEPNNQPETIYLHTKIIDGPTNIYSMIVTKDYLNKEADIRLNGVSIGSGNIDAAFNVTSNKFAGIKKIFIQMSDNAMLTTTKAEQAKYRLVYSSVINNVKTGFDIKVNLNGFNVLDGKYFFKVTVIDASGKATEFYSDRVSIEAGVIDKLLKFDTPLVGLDGQIIQRSPIFITGNALISASILDNAQAPNVFESQTALVFFGENIDISRFSIKHRDGKLADSLSLKSTGMVNEYLIVGNGRDYNDWYYVYYDDKFCGIFLYQVNKIK